MLHIGQFCDTFLPIVDGVGRVVYSYATELPKLGHRVTVTAPMADCGYRGGFPFELVDFVSVRVPSAPQYQTGEAVMDTHYRQRMRMTTLDVCHAHSPFMTGTEAIRQASLRNIPLVGSFHSQYYEDFLKVTKSEMLAKIGLKLVVDFYSRCDEVWAVNKGSAKTLQEYGYNGEVFVMPNGTQQREVDPNAITEVTQQYDLGDRPVLLFVGQMDWKKNISCILEACANLRSAGVDFCIVLAGRGPDENAIREEVKALNLGERARIVGHIYDTRILDALYARADLFVFPSLYDSAPMVVREAAAQGTPSVMARGSVAAEGITDGENGLLCEDEAEDLSRVIAHALADREKLAKIGEAAKQTIPMPWPNIMEMAVERYQNLIELNQAGKLAKKVPRIL